MSMIGVKGFIDFSCTKNKTFAQIELFVNDGREFDINGKYELDYNCNSTTMH